MVTCAMDSIIAYATDRFGGVGPGSVNICVMKGLPAETDFVVVGGVAGLRAAIELALRDACWCWIRKLRMPDAIRARWHRTALSEKTRLPCTTRTLIAGDGLFFRRRSKPRDRRPERIEELIAWDEFNRSGTKLVFGLEARAAATGYCTRKAIRPGARFCGRSMPSADTQEYFHTGIRIFDGTRNR